MESGRHTLMQIKKVIYLSLLALLAIFILQNMTLVKVGFLFWEITMPRSVILAVTLVIGIIIGFGLRELASHRSKADKNE